MAKMTLKAMEAELNEWGDVYVDRVMRGNDKANRYEVVAPDGTRLAIGFERRIVLEAAYAAMQEMKAAPQAKPANTEDTLAQDLADNERYFVQEQQAERAKQQAEMEDFWLTTEPAAPAAEIVVPDVVSEYTIKQGVETLPSGRDSIYWILCDSDGRVVDTTDTREQAVELSLLLRNEQRLANARIAELEAENAKLKSDNERLSVLCMKAMRKLVGGDEVTAYKSLREATVMPQPTPAQEAPKPQPKFALRQEVVITSHIDKLHGTIIDTRIHDGNWQYLVQRYYSLITLWHNEGELKAKAAMPMPAEEVTLTEEEIDWLADNQIEHNRFSIMELPVFDKWKQVLRGKLYAHCSSEFPQLHLELKYTFDTAANHAAIANRRRELGLA